MALELRPNCELCDCDLAPDSAEARICSYECTFCVACVETILHDVCPNCAGGFVPRPIRPLQEWRPGLSLEKRPPSTTRIRCGYSRAAIEAFASRVKNLPARERSQRMPWRQFFTFQAAVSRTAPVGRLRRTGRR